MQFTDWCTSDNGNVSEADGMFQPDWWLESVYGHNEAGACNGGWLYANGISLQYK